MISHVEIKDNTKTPFRYLKDCFDNGRKFEFSAGNNIIIGPNGSGKSTLLNVIKCFTFTDREMYSCIPDKAYLYPNLWNDKSFDGVLYDKEDKEEVVELLDGVDIKSDYKRTVFCYKNKLDKDFVAESMVNFALMTTQGSTGENALDGLGHLFDLMFNKGERHGYKFPIDEFENLTNRCNSLWSKRISALLAYYDRNRIEDNGKYTVLMDEPDRNLDMDNINSVYDILSYQRDDTQIIAVVHNPILIIKLADMGINVIETKKGYLQKIRKFLKS